MGGADADLTARPRFVCDGVSAGCTWRNFGSACWLPGGGDGGRCLGPRGLRAPRRVRSGPGSPHLPRTLTLQCLERGRRPGVNRRLLVGRGLSRLHPSLLSSLPHSLPAFGSGFAAARACTPPGIRVSPPTRPCSAGEWIGAAPRLRDVREHPGKGSRARVSAAAGTARARPQERAGLGARLARVSAGASGRWEAGGTGWAREAGGGLPSGLQSLARQMGVTRGRAARSRRLSGAHRLGTRTPNPFTGGLRSRGAPAQGWGQWLLPSDAPFPKGGPSSPAWRCGHRSAAALGRTPSRGWRSPQLAGCLSCLRDEATERTPRPHRCPGAVAPVTFLCPSPTAPRTRSLSLSGQTEETTLVPGAGGDCGDATRILNSLEIRSPWLLETWRYRFACLRVCWEGCLLREVGT